MNQLNSPEEIHRLVEKYKGNGWVRGTDVCISCGKTESVMEQEVNNLSHRWCLACGDSWSRVNSLMRDGG